MLKKINKRALRPWATFAHLRITAYKGIRKHSFPRSPTLNLDRSVVSLRLYMEKCPIIMLTKLAVCRTSTFLYKSLSKTCDLGGKVIFGTQGHNLNKLRRASLDDATYIISRLYALWFQTRTISKPIRNI